LPLTRIVERLAPLDAHGVNLHDNDLVPIAATPAKRDW
jgi:xylose isomerase